MSNSVCRICEGNTVETLIDFGDQPIVNNLLCSHDEKYSTYPFRLGFCVKCGFLQLIDTINPEILYKNYFTVSSWKNQPHVQRLIAVIEDISGLNQKDKILEIGCNDGSFLEQLRMRGYVNAYGIEPTKDNLANNEKTFAPLVQNRQSHIGLVKEDLRNRFMERFPQISNRLK